VFLQELNFFNIFLKELDAIANELLSEFVVNKIDLNNQTPITATNLLYDNNHDNKLLFNTKLSSSDSGSSSEDENGAVRDDGTLQISHSSKPLGM
jgi:hypothetical protein